MFIRIEFSSCLIGMVGYLYSILMNVTFRGQLVLLEMDILRLTLEAVMNINN
ncbi:hypothetical protein [Paenibacillus sp. FSL R7-0026]|uniref:hypothetical protein n=1 Tax=Paenibacillus sp. FSL R7-0026 TaxID=2921668 RepID=UPI0030F64376